ncbi:MAG: alcohol dehydrogenase catalytic domain-containing protein [Myxococcaceae bacterium]|nr:alcohol dehydrogenase catalytic domain-containing protein [Myxococcaceae bacterium]
MRALVFSKDMPRIVTSRILGTFHDSLFMRPYSPLTFEEVPDPKLMSDDWVKIRTTVTGVCGSDVKQVFLNGQMDNPLTAVISFPHVLGHEATGVITEVGPKVKNRKVGERVVVNPWLSCAPRGISPNCDPCESGQYQLCSNFNLGSLSAGIHLGNNKDVGGGYAPLMAVHESMCFPIPDGVTDEEAVLADPFAVSLHAVLKRPPAPGSTALVYGCGTLGLLTILVLKTLYPKTKVLAVARFPHQKELALKLGADHLLTHSPELALIEEVHKITGGQLMQPWQGLPWIHGGGVDVTYDSVGYPKTIETALRVAAARGSIVMTGVEASKRFEWTPLYFKEAEFVGSNAFGIEDVNGVKAHAFEHYMKMVLDKTIDPTPLITHRFPLEQYRDAFLVCRRQGTSKGVKVIITHQEQNS